MRFPGLGGNAQARAEAKEPGAARARDEAPVTPRLGASDERGGSAVPAEAAAHTPPPAEAGRG